MFLQMSQVVASCVVMLLALLTREPTVHCIHEVTISGIVSALCCYDFAQLPAGFLASIFILFWHAVFGACASLL